MVTLELISTFIILSVLTCFTNGQANPSFEKYGIGTVTEFSQVRSCMICCFDSNNCGVSATNLPDALGCPVNSCLCRRQDISTSAFSFLNRCVSQRCDGNPADVTDAQNAFKAYCSVYLSNVGITTMPTGDVRADGGQPATMTVAAGTTTVTVAQVTSFVTRVSTIRDSTAEEGTTSGDGRSSGGLTTTSQIGLGVGLGIGIPALGLLAYIVYLLRKQEERYIQDRNGNSVFRPGGIPDDTVNCK